VSDHTTDDRDADPVAILERAIDQLEPEERHRAREALEELEGRTPRDGDLRDDYRREIRIAQIYWRIGQTQTALISLGSADAYADIGMEQSAAPDQYSAWADRRVWAIELAGFVTRNSEG